MNTGFKTNVVQEEPMNTFNRVAFIVILLAFVALAVTLLVFPIQALSWTIDNLQSLRDSAVVQDETFLWYMGALALFLLLCLTLLYLELRPSRKDTVLIQTEGGGKAHIGVDSVEQTLANRIDELPGVRDVRARVLSRGPDARVIVNLRTSPTVNIPEVTQQVVLLVREILEDQMGVKIRGDVEVNVSHEPFPRGTLAPGASGRPVPDREQAPRPAEEPRPTEERRPRRAERAPAPPRWEEERPVERERWPDEAPPPAPVPPQAIVAEDEFDLEPEDLGQEEPTEEPEEE
jgi:hypothetical protein